MSHVWETHIYTGKYSSYFTTTNKWNGIIMRFCCIYILANLPTLSDGISDVQFDNILYEFLNDRAVEDMTNTVDALTFQYTYWPQPKNFSMVRQRTIDVSG